jgi:mediator of replication checkpoint protein 1
MVDPTRSSPTASNGSPMPIVMTPRTKIRSMLLDIDDVSGSDAPRSRTLPNLASDLPNLRVESRSNNDLSIENGKNEAQNSKSEEEDELPVAPKGRMAARMRAQQTKARHALSGSEDSTVEEGENAYERIKKQLAMERGSPSKGNNSENRTNDDQSTNAAKSKFTRRFFVKKKQSPAVDDDDSALPSDQELVSQSAKVPTVTDDSEESAPHQFTRRFLTKKKQRDKQDSNRGGSSAPSRKSSPGLFVSPYRPSPKKDVAVNTPQADGSASRLETDPKMSSAFMALVEKKRKERQAKEAAEKKKKADKAAKLKDLRYSLTQSSDEDSDQDATGKKLTQQSRPTRKASKKALEEMNRETQRMSRNMQLAHQARTKKKITKQSFLARFNFGQVASSEGDPSPATKDPNASATASSVPGSDTEGPVERDTPPTSPLIADDSKKLAVVQDMPITVATEAVIHETEELPSIEEFQSKPATSVNKGKEKAQEGEPLKEGEFPFEASVKPSRPIRVKAPSPRKSRHARVDDSDDDLEILGSASMKKSRAMALLDRVPSKRTKEDRALLVLRSLAHLTSPSKQGPKNRPSISLAEMQASLRQKARQQAAQERGEKIQQL